MHALVLYYHNHTHLYVHTRTCIQTHPHTNAQQDGLFTHGVDDALQPLLEAAAAQEQAPPQLMIEEVVICDCVCIIKYTMHTFLCVST